MKPINHNFDASNHIMLKEFPGEKKVCNCQEDLLNLIENEDVFNILSEENMESFNELMKYELITVKDEKVHLTPLGKEAQIHGVKNVIGRKNVEHITTRITSAPSRVWKSFLIWPVLILFLALLYLVFQYIWQ